MTPRQAAHHELCFILGQLGGRSRRAQRAFLQDQLVRALERAHAAEDERLHFDEAALLQERRLVRALYELAQVRGECAERMLQIRCLVVSMAEHFRNLESACRSVLPLTGFNPVADGASNAADPPDTERDLSTSR